MSGQLGAGALAKQNDAPERRYGILFILLTISSVIIATSCAIFTVLLVRYRTQDIIAATDSRLLMAAELTREVLGPGYHDRIINQKSISREEFDRIVARNDDLCRRLNLQYLWSVLIVDNRIVFTSATHSDVNNLNSTVASFFETHHDPSAFTTAIYPNLKTSFTSFKNEWGVGRMVLVPRKDSHGRIYIFGASVQLSEFNALIQKTMVKSIGIGFAIFCVVFVFVLFLVRFLSLPLAKLSVTAGQIAKGNLDGPVVSARIREIQDLSTSIVEMRKRLKDTFSQLTESEKYYRLLFETMQQGVVYQDSQGRVISMNPSAVQILGFTPQELIGQTSVSVEHNFRKEDGGPLPGIEHPSMVALRTGHIVRDVVMQAYNRRENRYRWINVTAVPLFRDDQAGQKSREVYTVFSDITTRVQAEKDLKSAKEAAEAAARIKSRFLDTAAHELRTPVTGFSILLQLTQKQLEKGRAVDVSTLVRLRADADRISRLVVDLLDVSRLERGILNLKRGVIDIVSLITDCLEGFKIQAPKRVFLFSKPEKAVEISIDSVRIFQVISNLLDNALKYTPENSPIEVTIESDSNLVRVTVNDHGPGIPESEQARLFYPFERGNIEQTERNTGLGLGLFICRGLVELHGGTIGVKSQPGIGSAFYFELPRKVT